MRKSLWTLRLGIALTVAGLALLSPLGDLLPVSFWPNLQDLLSSGSLPAEPHLFRVVSGKASKAIEFMLIGAGLALAGASLYVRRRK